MANNIRIRNGGWGIANITIQSANLIQDGSQAIEVSWDMLGVLTCDLET